MTWQKIQEKPPKFSLVQLRWANGVTRMGWWTGTYWDAGKCLPEGQPVEMRRRDQINTH